jgi:hypothetical protein
MYLNLNIGQLEEILGMFERIEYMRSMQEINIQLYIDIQKQADASV